MPAGRRPGGLRPERRFPLFHPALIMIFFAAVLTVSLLSYHPLILSISLVGAALSLSFYLGLRVLGQSILWLFPMAGIVIVFNLFFNRRGATELFALETFQLSFTLESLLFGFSIALMMLAVLLWFRLYQELMTSDRFLHLCTPLAPNLALSISMVQRWIPLTRQRWQEMRDARRMQNAHAAIPASKGYKYRSLAQSLSALMSWSMENAVQAADSMQARGYGQRERPLEEMKLGAVVRKEVTVGRVRRTSFRSFPLRRSDLFLSVGFVTLAAVAGTSVFLSTRELMFFPVFWGAEELSVFALLSTLFLVFFPLLIEGGEHLRWKFFR